jgi:uncharacterized metal-binding protein YceD (DUF177 family)
MPRMWGKFDMQAEFSRPIPIAEISRNQRHYRIAVAPDEAAFVAARLGVSQLRSLSADLTVAKRRGAVEVEGHFDAEVVQVCVVSLEPFTAKISGDVDEVFSEPDEQQLSAEIAVDLDTPEPLDGDNLDLGELVVQCLALEIDPHPRAPDATLDDLEAPEDEGLDPTHPFAGLAKLRQKP